MKLGIAKLENLFRDTKNKPFTLSQHDVENLFEISNLENKQVLQELHDFLHYCGIELIPIAKFNTYGFMRVWDTLQWESKSLNLER